MATANTVPLLIIAFSIVLSTNGLGCREEALLAIEDKNGEVVISIFNANPHNSSVHDSVKHTISGHRLSQECGPKLFRCQKLLEETLLINRTQRSIVFIPLVVGLAILDVVRDAESSYHMQHTILRTDWLVEISCSPSSVFKILNNYFAICTNQTTNFVSVVEIQLNKTDPMSTQILYPSNQKTIPSSVGNISNSSNYIHIEIDPGDPDREYLVFAIDTAFYSLRPFIYEETRLDDVPSETCDRVQTLVPLSGSVFYAYCSDHFFTYDIGYGRWSTQYAIMGVGTPYLCPEPEADLNVFSGYIQYAVDGLNRNVDIQGESPSRLTGECFGNASQSYFAFQEEDIGVSVLNLTSFNSEAVPGTSACKDDCLPLIVVEDRYLIVRNPPENKVSVQDYFGNRLELIEIFHTKASLVALLQLKCVTSPPGGKVVPMDPVSPHLSIKLVVSVTATFAVMVLVICGIGFSALMIYLVYTSAKKRCRVPISETGGANLNKDHNSMVTLHPAEPPKQETPVGREKTFQSAGFTDLSVFPTTTHDHNNASEIEMSDMTPAVKVHVEYAIEHEMSAISQSSEVSSIHDDSPLLK